MPISGQQKARLGWSQASAELNNGIDLQKCANLLSDFLHYKVTIRSRAARANLQNFNLIQVKCQR